MSSRSAAGIARAGVKLRTRLLLAGLLAVTVAAVCIRAGFWQLDRLEQRREYNATVAAAIAAPPLVLDSAALARIAAAPEDFLYRRATAEGVFLNEEAVLLRGRAHEGAPGVHLAAPLRLQPNGGLVLVNRGWLPAPDGATVDPREFAALGPQLLLGSLQAVPDAGAEAAPLPLTVDGAPVMTFRRLDRAAMAERLGEPVPPLYLQLLPAPDERGDLPAAVPPPPLDEGPHLGYAIQWFSFATIAILGYGVLVYHSRRSAGARLLLLAPDSQRR